MSGETRYTPGPEGEVSLRRLGVDYYYDAAEWEATYDSDDTSFAADLLDDRGEPDEPYELDTLIRGPKLWAALIPTAFGSDGDVEDTVLRFFASDADARAALARAKGDQS